MARRPSGYHTVSGRLYWIRARSFRRGVLGELEARYGVDARRDAEAAEDDPERTGPVALARQNGYPFRHSHIVVTAIEWYEQTT